MATSRPSITYAIDLVDVSKAFKRKTIRGGYSTVKSSLVQLFRPRQPKRATYTQVLRDVTLRIPSGSSVGVIGRNGSGKSTLLKLITGIYRPDCGTVQVRGRVAALIELGAGFHPDFTGRENVYLAAAMYGLSKREIAERFDAIVEFAELAEVIDDPVRTYSSGMFMRLGFSLAIHTDPDVLLIDEVLAVGDAAFVAKCKDEVAKLRKAGKTLLLVTHDLEAVERWCDEVLWIHGGDVRERGEPRRVIDAYREFLERGEEQQLLTQERESQDAKPTGGIETATPCGTESQRWGSREVEITSVRLIDRGAEERRVFHPDDALDIEIAYAVREPVQDIVFGIGIQREDGLIVHGSNTDIEREPVPALGRSGVVRYTISRLGLLDGTYHLDAAVHRADGYPYDYHKNALTFAVRSAHPQVGVIVPPHRWEFIVAEADAA